MSIRSSRNKKKKAFNLNDPYAMREAEKYAKPIPSRELILGYLAHCGTPLLLQELAAGLGLSEEEDLEAFRRRVNAMERDGQILRNRKDLYCLINKKDLIAGRVIGHPDGFGFLRPDEGGEDLFLSPKEMRVLMHDDRAVVRIKGFDRRGRREGAVVEVLERNTHQVVGRLYNENGICFVAPDSKRIAQDILIPPSAVEGAGHGQIVVAEIVEQPSKRARPIGKVIEVLGEHMAPGMEIEVAIRAYELPCDWPVTVLEDTAKFGPEVPESAKQNRVDLRDIPLVTIDGEDARDFDDAVFCQRTSKGWRLLVAIADVSHYVSRDSALDHEARKRGTSVYFPERVIPMLPEALSNGLCSLNPEEDRLCMVCEMLVHGDGKVIRSRFFEGVMRSHARLTYTAVAEMLVDGDKSLRKRYRVLMPHLEELYALYKVLRECRETRGAMDFDTQETRIIFGAGRKIECIVPVMRNDAHRLIEEFMIMANMAAARFLNRRKMPKLLRIHEGPPAEKIAELRTFLAELGLRLTGGDRPEPRDYMALTKQIHGRPDAHLIQTVLLRSLSQAVYSPELKGHFGLALDAYAHFTSPIRRYPDLLVHRAIRHSLQGKPSEAFYYSHSDMVSLGEHCSSTERRADEATRDVESWLKCEYMLDKLGEEFDGIISAVTSFGFFVELKEIYVEGLIHIANLDRDYFHFDPIGHRLIGERSGITYRLGDAVRVAVARVDLDEKKIDFELIRNERKGKKRLYRRRRK
ncbi:MAG: ribonuclease R [Pseudomonadota bacterium]